MGSSECWPVWTSTSWCSRRRARLKTAALMNWGRAPTTETTFTARTLGEPLGAYGGGDPVLVQAGEGVDAGAHLLGALRWVGLHGVDLSQQVGHRRRGAAPGLA